jgi:hypothetical protein
MRVEEVMAKKAVAKKYMVDYKGVNDALKKKKQELEKLQKKVDMLGKIDLELQIRAMSIIIQKCKAGKMTATYNGS